MNANYVSHLCVVSVVCYYRAGATTTTTTSKEKRKTSKKKAFDLISFTYTCTTNIMYKVQIAKGGD